ncbi:response regulator [Microbacterium sp. P07]|uniref:response regulator n=1 Tax=Microbacterium sp. P07 TaxID=3366952 RepID=UPI003745A22E
MIRTLIVDDARAVRKSLRVLLETTDDIEVVGEAENGIDAVRIARHLLPDVVLMDLRMPNGDGLDAIEALSGIGVEEPIPVIVFTTFHLDEYLYGAFERGAVGFLLKKNPGDIPAAIRAAVNAGALQSPTVRQRMIAEYARGSTRARTRENTRGTRRPGTQGDAGRPLDPQRPVATQSARPPSGMSLVDALTERELEVVSALADGLSNKQIAARLGLGENTVKWHIGNMLDKTGASDRTQLALWAFQRGLNP